MSSCLTCTPNQLNCMAAIAYNLLWALLCSWWYNSSSTDPDCSPESKLIDRKAFLSGIIILTSFPKGHAWYLGPLDFLSQVKSLGKTKDLDLISMSIKNFFNYYSFFEKYQIKGDSKLTKIISSLFFWSGFITTIKILTCNWKQS